MNLTDILLALNARTCFPLACEFNLITITIIMIKMIKMIIIIIPYFASSIFDLLFYCFLKSSIVYVADKATHISQLERLGRQQISRDIMPMLKGNMWIDGHAVESETITPATHRKQVSHRQDKADTEMSVHASHLENGAGQLVQICEPLATIVPKSEPVEEVVVPPKESKRIRRKTTLRREGRDDFLQITFGEITNWQSENSHRNRQENLKTIDVLKKALIGTEMTARHSEIKGTSQDVESDQETEHPVRFQPLSATTDLPPVDTVGTDGGVHWLKPKPEHGHGGD